MNLLDEYFTRQSNINSASDQLVDEDMILILFSLGPHRYAIPIDHTREILDELNMTIFPRETRGFYGVLNLRGNLVPVLNPEILTDSKVDVDYKNSKTILFDIDGEQFGMCVEKIRKVIVTKSELGTNTLNHRDVIKIENLPVTFLTGQRIIDTLKENYLGNHRAKIV